MSCRAYVEKGGILLAGSRAESRPERRHRHCKRTATTSRTFTVNNLRNSYEREVELCGHHARLFDENRANVRSSDW